MPSLSLLTGCFVLPLTTEHYRQITRTASATAGTCIYSVCVALLAVVAILVINQCNIDVSQLAAINLHFIWTDHLQGKNTIRAATWQEPEVYE